MKDLDNNVKGAVAEQAIVLEASKLGIPVLRPVNEHGRCDLALEIGDRLWRVQCKWGRLGSDGNVVIVHLFTCRYTPNGYVRRTYAEREVDLFGVYCGELDRCFLIPSSKAAGLSQIQLRLVPTRNGQQACINLADDFDFDGAVAQLGRAPRWQRGGQGFESPQLHSSEAGPVIVGSNPFRDRFGYWMERVAGGEEVLITHRGKPRMHLVPAADLTPPAPRTPRTTPR